MSLAARLVLNILSGLAIGASIVALVVAGALALSFVNGAGVTVPAIIEIWTTSEPNGTTALNFLPSPVGMLVAVVGIAATYAIAATVIARRRARRS